MSNIFLISDQHYSHANFLNFLDEAGNKIRPFFNVEEMDEYMVFCHNSVVRPCDKVYFLGDVCFNKKTLDIIMPRLNGTKVLIKGNHDNLKLTQYQEYFKDVRASHQLDKYVLTHIPLHPEHMGRWANGNIHGHLHQCKVMKDGVEDLNYINVSVECINYTPISLEEIKKKYLGKQ